MTLTDYILRDMEISCAVQRKRASEMTVDEIDREVRRRRRRRIRRACMDIVGGCLLVIGVVAFAVGCIACSGYHWE